MQDLSYWAFKELADPNAGVIDLMYERLPFCPKADLGVRTPTCDECVSLCQLLTPVLALSGQWAANA